MPDPATAAAAKMAPPPRVRGWVALWASFAVVVAGLLLYDGLAPPSTLGQPLWVLAVVAIAAVVTSGPGVVMRVGPTNQVHTLNELAAIPAVVLLPADWAVVVMTVGLLIAEGVQGKHPGKLAFNGAWVCLSTAAASAAYWWVAPASLASFEGLLATLLAAVAFAVTNLGAFVVLLLRLTDRTLRDLMPDEWASLLVSMSVSSIGLLATYLLTEAPALLPLLVVPALLARSQSEQRRRAQEAIRNERDRLDRTVAGATDGIALLDRAGRIEVWNPSLAALSGTPTTRALRRPVGAALRLRGRDGRPLPILDELDAATPEAPTVTLEGAMGDPHRIVQVDATALFDHTSRTGAVIMVRDVTRQRELERMREDLVSRVSHELRTPLTTVSGFLETVLTRWGELSDGQRRQHLATAHRSARRLARLVGGLLAKARIEGATTPPHVRAVRLGPALDDLLEELGEPLAGQVRIDVEPHVAVRADPDHLHQIIENLVTNASLYGAPPIDISVWRERGIVVIRIKDHGPGVPQAFVPDLFEAFTQASTGDRREARGLGLGLSIVRALTRANDGTIAYVEDDEAGACFEVRLPAASVALVAS